MDKRVLVFENGNARRETFKSTKEAYAFIYALKRGDREMRNVYPKKHEYTVRQVDFRTDRLNKQARRAFEAQEV